ncbi:Crp/Fnr family transcriptional regulator [Photobacterium sagamiensis]|uniref:Crp/Fnr family transcriptional regulator n=1 Tax=Photobacterium sagamiensis TaxID=2910241 RepID=UPI003D10C9A9
MNVLIDQIQWPCEISHSLKTQLVEISSIIHGVDKFICTRQMASVPAVYYVQEGVASFRLCSEGIKGVNSLLIGPGDWIGGSAIAQDMKLFVSVEEIESMSLVSFPKEKIFKLAQSNNEVYKWLYYCAMEIQKILLQAQISSLYDREIRTVYALLDIANRVKSVKGSMSTIKISQHQLSLITGISRPRVNEVLKSLEKKGEIIIQRECIYLADLQALGARIENLNLMFNDPRKDVENQ